MPASATLRINMTGRCEDPAEESARYRAALDMAVHAEQKGFTAVAFEEHHCAENGWLPSPLTMAAMAIARTERVRVTVGALLVTLYDPIRLAEDIAVLDLVSQGRFSFIAGLGYRPLEYHATGRPWAERGAWMDEVLDTLLLAWSGEPFAYRGQTLRVTPVPLSRPHPFFMIGGMTPRAARRAARRGLPFYPPIESDELEAAYREELERCGKGPGLYLTPGASNAMLLVDPDPERAWSELAPYFLRELREYSSWKLEGVRRPGEQPVETVDDLRRQGRFVILTPEDAVKRLREDPAAVVHPLAGGIPLERAWQLLECFCDDVLPHV